MNYKIDFDKNNDVCIIKVSGNHKRSEESYELLHAAGAYSDKHKCSRFLFDMRKAKISGGLIDAFNVGAHPEKHGFSRKNRIAAVYSNLTENDKFLQTVATNRGAWAFRVFDNMGQARKWIAS